MNKCPKTSPEGLYPCKEVVFQPIRRCKTKREMNLFACLIRITITRGENPEFNMLQDFAWEILRCRFYFAQNCTGDPFIHFDVRLLPVKFYPGHINVTGKLRLFIYICNLSF